MNADSLFDLTPPEKLQLVEDLWDDLAATPSDVPIYDWQKEELARRFAAEDELDWNYWIEFFSRTREPDNRRKGLVEIEL